MTDSGLVVDLRGHRIETLDDFWDAVAEPCGLPGWFGRNLDAWADTIHSRGISDVIDRHRTLTVHVDRTGLFAGNRPDAQALADTFDGEHNHLITHTVA
ncbi:barstar family protein [Streptomyces sp. BE308]|uniref:barstar family protein n=1 Tax=Streptomyces sp. BE308 TaxID=3002529 RepID=UPI002E780D64|nr:barstar family protein [Streptomyces sp. BE308]MEE1792592.1 barstar family protein [Streptomyces sp. BE308]